MSEKLYIYTKKLSNMKNLFLFFLSLCLISALHSQIPVNQWEKIVVDSNRDAISEIAQAPLQNIVADARDVSRHGYRIHVMNRDGYKDIISGNYYYRNPGSNMTGNWERFEFSQGVSGILFTNINDYDIDDIIAVSGSDVYWYEVFNQFKKMFNVYKIGSVPESDHLTGYGLMADIIKGEKPELLIMGGEGIYMAEIPQYPDSTMWEFTLIAETRTMTDFDVADINGNGYQDIVCTLPSEKGDSGAMELVWFENPGKKSEKWASRKIGTVGNPISGISVVDFYGNGKPEIIITEKSVGEPKSNLLVFSMPESGNLQKTWVNKTLGRHNLIQSLDIIDFNKNGKIDILISDYNGIDYQIYAYLNEGSGNFRKEIIYNSKSFSRIRAFDLDGDKDIDIIGFGGENNTSLVVLRNDAIQNPEIGRPWFVVYDDTSTITEASRGFYRFQPSLVAGTDWTSPFDFYNGTMYARWEVTQYPSEEPFQLQFCIWSEVKEGRFTPGNWKEMCSPHTDLKGVDLATDIALPAEMWRLNPDEPCDFSKISDFRFMGIVVRCGNRLNCTDMVPKAIECWEQRHLIYPFKVRFSLVALAQGETFTGWENYIDLNRFWDKLPALPTPK